MNIIKRAKQDVIRKLEQMSGEYSTVARAISVDPSTIAKLVRGGMDSNPRINMIIALHDYLFSAEPRTNSVGQAVAVAPISSDRREGYEGRV